MEVKPRWYTPKTRFWKSRTPASTTAENSGVDIIVFKIMNLPSRQERVPRVPMRCAAAFALSLLSTSVISAGLVDVPAAVRPGAIRPGEERLSVPEQPAPAVYEVPAIVERPLDIDAGAKIRVSSFQLVGSSDRPEHNIFTADVQALIDAKLNGQGEGLTVGRIQ